MKSKGSKGLPDLTREEVATKTMEVLLSHLVGPMPLGGRLELRHQCKTAPVDGAAAIANDPDLMEAYDSAQFMLNWWQGRCGFPWDDVPVAVAQHIAQLSDADLMAIKAPPTNPAADKAFEIADSSRKVLDEVLGRPQ